MAICGTTSLCAQDPEATPKDCFLSGYSCDDLSFVKLLEGLLGSCGIPKSKVKPLSKKIIALSEKHGLDCRKFEGKACESNRPGHLLQIFVKRTIVDKYV